MVRGLATVSVDPHKHHNDMKAFMRQFLSECLEACTEEEVSMLTRKLVMRKGKPVSLASVFTCSGHADVVHKDTLSLSSLKLCLFWGTRAFAAIVIDSAITEGRPHGHE